MEATPHLVLRVLSEAGDPAAWDNAPACAPLHACADVRGAPCPPARHQTGCRLPLCSSGKRASHRSAGKSVSVTRVSLRSSGTLGPERGCNSQGAQASFGGGGRSAAFQRCQEQAPKVTWGQAKGSRTPRPPRGRVRGSLILASLSSPGGRRGPLPVAPRMQKTKAGGPAGNPFHRWEHVFLPVKNAGENVVGKKKRPINARRGRFCTSVL